MGGFGIGRERVRGRCARLVGHGLDSRNDPAGPARVGLVDLIGHTRTTTGLRVKAALDKRRYQIGTTLSSLGTLDNSILIGALTVYLL